MTQDSVNQPEISIILPTYNQADYLPASLKSIFEQTFTDFELIVVNDGSTDNTAEVLAEYQKTHDFQVVDQENKRLPRALNAGFDQACGKYYTWTSSDNIMLPTMLEELYTALDNSDPSLGVVYADWYLIDENGQVFNTDPTLDYDRHLLLRHNFVHCCFLFRSECMKRVGNYDPKFIYYEDWEFWIRVAQEFDMQRVPKALYQYRIHSDSMTTKIVEDNAPRRVGYEKFADHLKSFSLIDWYMSKVKWKLLKFRLGSSPRQKWQQNISLNH